MKYLSLLFSILLISIVAFSVGSMVYAHGEGASFEVQSDGYLVDIGYDPETVEALSSVRYTFDLFSSETNEDAGFTDLWVRINQERKTLFASGVNRPEFGVTGMVYTFPESGTYEVSVRFQRDGEKLTEVTFPVEVIENADGTPDTQFPLVPVGSALLGLVVGVGATLVVTGKKKDIQSPTDQ